MRSTKRRTLRVEALEDRALLSGVRVHLEALAARRLATRQVQATPGTGTTALPVAEVQAMQQDASTNNLELYLSQIAALKGKDPGVQQYANMLLTDHQGSAAALGKLAATEGVILPVGLVGADFQTGQAVLAAANGPNFDQTYLMTMVQTHSQLIATAQRQAVGTTDPAFQQFLMASLPTDQTHLAAAQSLLGSLNQGGNGNVGNPNGGTPPTTYPAGSDAAFITQMYSAGSLEMLLGATAMLDSTNPNVQQYGAKLIADHRLSNRELFGLAQQNGVTLPPGIQGPQDQNFAQQLLASVNTPNFDTTALGISVQAHTSAIQAAQQEAATTTDPNLRQFALNAIPTLMLHRLGAQTLLAGGPTTPPPPTTGGPTTSPLPTTGGTGTLAGNIHHVQENFSHRNGTLRYSLSYSSNGYRVTQTYTLSRKALVPNPPINGFNPFDAANLFNQAIQQRIAQATGANLGTGGNNLGAGGNVNLGPGGGLLTTIGGGTNGPGNGGVQTFANRRGRG